MPIEADKFIEKKQPSKPKKRGHNQNTILDFLLVNYKQAFTQSEIQQETKIKYGPSVNSALHSLSKQGKISCRSIKGLLYWRAI